MRERFEKRNEFEQALLSTSWMWGPVRRVIECWVWCVREEKRELAVRPLILVVLGECSAERVEHDFKVDGTVERCKRAG